MRQTILRCADSDYLKQDLTALLSGLQALCRNTAANQVQQYRHFEHSTATLEIKTLVPKP